MRHLHHKILSVAAAIVGITFVISYSLRFSARPAIAPSPAEPTQNVGQSPSTSPQDMMSTPEPPSPRPEPATEPTAQHDDTSLLAEPLTNARARVTKKTFGLYVTPKQSPVQPERFTGYHSGTDFETTPEEKDADVAVHAVCDGPLALKRTASGYGGVVVQRCVLNGADITVVYGHLRLASVTTEVGASLKRGQLLGLLGTGYSKETDGERKHLHLGVHKGKTISITGYESRKAGLFAWIDPLTIIP